MECVLLDRITMLWARFSTAICFALLSCATENHDRRSHPDTAADADTVPGDAALPPTSGGDASRTNDAKPPAKPDAGPVCKDDPGPTISNGIGRAVLPWKLSIDADAGTTAPDAGADGGRTSAMDAGTGASCQKSRSTYPFGGSDLHCRGWAATRRTDSELELQFADGSTLQWDPDLVENHVAAPDVRDGDSVWVDYEQSTVAICPYCGTRATNDLQIRGDQDGQILWMGREGTHFSDVDDSLVHELFGVPSHLAFACSASIPFVCFTTDRRVYDRVLATDPEQIIRHATMEHVVTPGGAYDVFWTHTESTVHGLSNCSDGPEPREDYSFAVSRTPN